MAEVSSADQLETLSANPRELSIGGKTIVVRPLRFMELARCAKLMGPILRAVDQIDPNSNGMADISGLLAEAPEAIAKITSISCDQPVEWLDTLEADEGLELVLLCYEVNKTFFVQRLGPQLTKGFQALKGFKKP
jgi:hypothetical protein